MSNVLTDVLVAEAFSKVIPVSQGDGKYSGFTTHSEWGVTDGAYTFEISNDPRANPLNKDHATSRWEDITALVGATNPTGVAGDDWTYNVNIGADYLRVTFVPGILFGTNFMAVGLMV